MFKYRGLALVRPESRVLRQFSISEVGHFYIAANTWHIHQSRAEPQRPVGHVPRAGRPARYDQPVAEGSRSCICQRTVGEDPLPGHGPVTSSNRPVRTRMPGGVGAGGVKPPATRLGLTPPPCLGSGRPIKHRPYIRALPIPLCLDCLDIHVFPLFFPKLPVRNIIRRRRRRTLINLDNRR